MKKGVYMSNFVQDFFVYEVDFSAAVLLAGVTTSGNIAIQADSDFKLLKMCYFADSDNTTDASRVIPAVQCTITDQGSGRMLMNQPVPISSIFGTGQIPFIMPVPRIFTARSIIVVSVTNFATSAVALKLSFIGAKILRSA
jgi:hypothetical protein